MTIDDCVKLAWQVRFREMSASGYDQFVDPSEPYRATLDDAERAARELFPRGSWTVSVAPLADGGLSCSVLHSKWNPGAGSGFLGKSIAEAWWKTIAYELKNTGRAT